MSDEDLEVAAPSSEVANESHDHDESSNSNVDSTHDDVDQEITEKARKMGHVSKDKFKGDPSLWVDAKTFVERGENYVPILKSQLKRQQEQMAELQKALKDLSEYHSKTAQREYEKAYKELKAQQLQAVANADHAAFVEIDQQIVDLAESANEAANAIPKVKDEPEQKQPDPDFIVWSKDNSWYGKDAEMSEFADSIAPYVTRKNPNASYGEVLDLIKERVKKEFPSKFINAKRATAHAVEASQPAAKKGGRTFADLPKSARDTFDRWQRTGQVKITKEEYVATYGWDEE